VSYDELVERVKAALDGCTSFPLDPLARQIIALIRPVVLGEVSADLSAAADEVERAKTMPTHNKAIAWALRSAALRYLAKANESKPQEGT